MKTKIIIEIETQTKQDLIEANGEEIAKKIEKEVHEAIFLYLDHLITADDFDYYVFDNIENAHGFEYLPHEDCDSEFRSYTKSTSISLTHERYE